MCQTSGTCFGPTLLWARCGALKGQQEASVVATLFPSWFGGFQTQNGQPPTRVPLFFAPVAWGISIVRPGNARQV